MIKRHKIHYILYVLVVTIIIDVAMAQLFWERLATHPEYFAVGFRLEDSYFHHGLKKNVSAIDSWGGLYAVTTNSLGLKDSTKKTVKITSEKKRIVFIGDSFTEGLGFPFEKTFVGLISKALQTENIEVLNAGVGSYSPKLYYLKMSYLLDRLRLKIDRLVVFIDVSDIQDEIVYKNFTPRDHDACGALITYLKYYMIRHSVIGNIGDRLINNKAAPAYEADDEFAGERGKWYQYPIYEKWGKKGSLLAEDYMRRLVQLCGKHNIALSIVVYPWPEQLWEGTAENGHVLFWKRFAEQERVRFFNLTPFFLSSDPGGTADKYYLPDDIHFNEAGHALVADTFLRWYGYAGSGPH